MKFSYQVEELPKGNEPYRVATDIEGYLSVVSNSGDVLFEADGILLVELAIFCKKWLSENTNTDFYYASMDFEEEPILAFSVKSNDICSFSSVWQKSPMDSIPLSEIKSSMSGYIEDLKANLKNNFQVDIEGYEGL
ncbi:hypothetical protein JF50_18020 [Pseudoalteromonas luteoviolacea]|uniref:DUF7878 domain-containing protein n=1 Tax=Pseudoalteromonas luteoviolacea TaxID=43657 RepID=A0A0C1Q9T3_9GAMM|nr:hypothetical protein [Pseudoalteromonas luteoviolacea]KID56175.1 hypothetical protein JF50_18020 [Pseudoalteromonas luteoviolacea]